MIGLKRIYEPANPEDGARFLVERLWPRGVKKEALRLEAWLKDVAPSHELRKWYGHDPGKWREFRRRYFSELDSRPDAVKPIRNAARKGAVTLLFSSRDRELSCAMALAEYLGRPP